MRQEKPQDRRRFERVPLALDWGEMQPLLGAIVHWPNHETSAVYDMSYFGLALGRPALYPLDEGHTCKVQLELGRKAKVEVSLKIAWAKTDLVGARILDLQLKEREAFDSFLEDRMIGRHMRMVDRRYHHRDADFTVWYHGPRDTNVYLWQDPKTCFITKGEIELDGYVIVYDGKSLTQGGHSSRSLTDEIGFSAAEEPVLLNQSAPLLERAMAILSQIDEPRGPMRDFLSALSRFQS